MKDSVCTVDLVLILDFVSLLFYVYVSFSSWGNQLAPLTLVHLLVTRKQILLFTETVGIIVH